jgi:hypothetical protein
MNLNFKELLPDDFSDESRVWIYQSNRIFTLSEALEIEKKLELFINEWKSHQVPVKGFATLFFGQFILLMADETKTGVSGCSTDGSVRLIKQIEQEYRTSMFDRTSLAFVIKDRIQLLPLSQLPYAFQHGFLKPETLFFDNNVQNKADLISKWIIPVNESWLWKRYSSLLN